MAAVQPELVCHGNAVTTLKLLAFDICEEHHFLPGVRTIINIVRAPNDDRAWMLAICDNDDTRRMPHRDLAKTLKEEFGFHVDAKWYADRHEPHWNDSWEMVICQYMSVLTFRRLFVMPYLLVWHKLLNASHQRLHAT